MLNTTTIESIFTWFLDLQEPIWLLTAIIPVGLAYLYVTRRKRLSQVVYKSEAVELATVAKRLDRKGRDRGDREFWRRHLPASGFILVLLILVPLISQPTITVKTVEERSLITWLIDTSQSMETIDVTDSSGQQISRLAGVVETLGLTIDQAPDNSFRQLVTFSDKEHVVTQPLTRSSEELATQVAALAETELTHSTATEAGLKTAGENCVRTSELVEQYGSQTSDDIQATDNQLTMPCVVILLSDGECDNQPFCTREAIEIADQAQTRGIRIHTVSWGDPNGDRSKVFLPDTQAMQAIASAGGGQHLETADTTKLVDLYSEVMDQVENQTVPEGMPTEIVWLLRLAFAIAALVFWPSYLKNQALVIRPRSKE